MQQVRTVTAWDGRALAQTRRRLVTASISGPAVAAAGPTGDGRLIERATTNEFANPSAEVDASNYAGFGGGDTVAWTTEAAWDGSASVKFTRVASVGSSFVALTGVSLDAASVYVATAYVQVFGGFAPDDLRLESVDMAGLTQSYRHTWTSADGEGAWVRLETLVATTSVESGSIRVRTSGGAPSAGGGFYVDGVQIEAGAWPTAFVDGSRGAAGVTLPAAQVSSDRGGVVAWVTPGWDASDSAPHTVFERAGEPGESLRLAFEGGSWLLESVAGSVSASASLTASHSRGEAVCLVAGWSARTLTLSDGASTVEAARSGRPAAIGRGIAVELGRRSAGGEAFDGVVGPVVFLDRPVARGDAVGCGRLSSMPGWPRGFAYGSP